MKPIRVGDIPVTPQAPAKKGMVSLSGVLIALSLGVALWLMHEVGLLGFANVSAGTGSEPTVEKVRDSLEQKEKELKQREEALARKQSEMEDKEKILKDQIESYQKTVDDLKAKVSAAGQVKAETKTVLKTEDKLETMLAIYEKMEPKRAALILEKLELPHASRLLGRMAPNRAAEILGLMTPDRARMLTERQLSSTGVKISVVNEVPQTSK